ncbi:putative oxidoreductase [Hyphodiscus hymeniophilus]|uniref:Oxidoreductase n=1 Tax=Hyphodiscus hymeniophilus TaxID=353542 RepID=A0A9P6VPU9_9HELO|nr:putative oxidoreductase [Hyphodiscus hymeniophilus]
MYGNEKEVGEAVQRSGLKRSDVFITTKIWSAAGSVDKTYQEALDSVHKIDGEDGYVDLFLIHQARGSAGSLKEMYLALEKLLETGKTRSIGVSNWGIGHIEKLKSFAKVYPPHVNQIELHPFCQQREIVDFCHKNGIIVEAYSPLVRNKKAGDPTLNEIGKRHGKSVAQVLIRYCLQKNWVPLPKSDTPSRILENADVYDFELMKDDMDKLDGLDEGSNGALVQAVKNT